MKKIVFLHIPKTGGQSVHHFFETSFKKTEIFPGRINEQLAHYSIDEMNNYKIFSGHFDWDIMGNLQGPKYTFTILRDPKERIFSFYFYLRNKAEKLTKEKLNSPQNQGMKAALELTPNQYFCDKTTKMRSFIDNHYDNFYTFYFAGRKYNSRQEIISNMGSNNAFKSMDNVLSLAMENLKTLDNIYNIANWKNLFNDLKEFTPQLEIPNEVYHVNKGDGLNIIDRINQLKNLGATEKTFEVIDQFCKYDSIIYNHVAQ